MNQEFYQNDNNNVVDTLETPKKNKKNYRFAKKVGAFALSGLILGTTAGGAFTATSYLFPAKSSTTQSAAQNSVQNNLPTTLTSFGSDSSSKVTGAIQEIAAKGLPSVVAITNIGVSEIMTMWGNMQQESESCGSGIIVGKTDKELLMVTNYHVIADNNTLTVVFSYDEASEEPNAVEAYVKGYDESRDLAVIAISMDHLTDDVLSKISVASIGDSTALGLGEQVVAIGNALGYGQSVTTGIVSALNRTISTDGSSTSDGNTYIQTDAAINPGNSGGALFNMNGELIGINSAKIASNEIEGMGYAIPISDVKDMIEDMMNQTARTKVYSDNEKGSLGITGTDVTDSANSTYGIPAGVYVYSVEENSAAADAGITKGDVITKFDGKSVTSSSQLQSLITYYKAGETVTVTIQTQGASGYEEKEVNVTLGKSAVKDKNTTEQAVPSDSYSTPYSNQSPYGNEYYANGIYGNQFA